MKKANSVDWQLLLNEDRVSNLISEWSTGKISTRKVTSELSYTSYAGEFRKLVRERGTLYGRSLARKALRYRGVSV